jgi:oxygen-dependent protoporphyrinogen oxidase
MPGLAATLHQANTLQAAVALALSHRAQAAGSPFATIDGGLSRLVDAVVAAMPSVEIRSGLPVREMSRDGRVWRLVVGPTREPSIVETDAVVLAIPSRPAARLLDPVSREVAVDVGVLDYASIGLVTYVLPAGALDSTPLAGKSGALIPAIEGRLAKAITVFSSKWRPQADDAVLLRASVGRYGEERSLSYDDSTLVGLVHDDLGKIVGGTLPPPIASAVNRWGGALPQYAPGHLDRVSRARASLPPTIALAGAAFDGVGIPACIRSGERAADAIVAEMGRMGS